MIIIDLLRNSFIFRSIQKYTRSDSGPVFTAKAVRECLNQLSEKTGFIKPDNPWENGYITLSNGKSWNILFDREIFTTLERLKSW